MEFYPITALLKESPNRTIDVRVSHFEDIPNWKDAEGIQHEVVVLGIRDLGHVVHTGTCVIKGKTPADIKELKDALEMAWKGYGTIKVRISSPGKDAPYTWPEVHFFPAAQVEEETEK